jgi:hypothetical protein
MRPSTPTREVEGRFAYPTSETAVHLLGNFSGMSAVCLGARIATGLWDLDTKVEADAEAVMHAVALHEAAVFPVLPGGVSIDERQARRTLAYRVAAYDGVPSSVRVAAAAALEAIDR